MPSKQSLLSHHELNFLFVDWVDFFLFTFKSFQLMRIYLSSSCFCGVHWKIRCLCSSVSFFFCCCVVCFSSLACLLLSNRISNSSNSSKWYFEYEGKWTVSKTLAHTHTHIQLRNNNTLTERVYDSWWCEQCKTHRHWIRIGMICFWFFFFTFFRSLLFFLVVSELLFTCTCFDTIETIQMSYVFTVAQLVLGAFECMRILRETNPNTYTRATERRWNDENKDMNASKRTCARERRNKWERESSTSKAHMIFSLAPRENQRERHTCHKEWRKQRARDWNRIHSFAHSLLSSLDFNTKMNRICIRTYTLPNVTCMRYAANTRARLEKRLETSV